MKLQKNSLLGFSLIEIMLALLVVSVGIVAMLGLLGSSLNSTGKSHSDITCTSFANMVLNWCHSETNWSETQIASGLRLKDYQGEEHVLVYNEQAHFNCLVTDSSGKRDTETFTVTYELQLEEQNDIKKIHLKVWPGYSTNTPSLLFYTELFNRFKT